MQSAEDEYDARYEFSSGQQPEHIGDVAAVKAMNITDLRRHLRSRGITPAGNRSTLQERLAEHLVQVRGKKKTF